MAIINILAAAAFAAVAIASARLMERLVFQPLAEFEPPWSRWRSAANRRWRHRLGALWVACMAIWIALGEDLAAEVLGPEFGIGLLVAAFVVVGAYPASLAIEYRARSRAARRAPIAEADLELRSMTAAAFIAAAIAATVAVAAALEASRAIQARLRGATEPLPAISALLLLLFVTEHVAVSFIAPLIVDRTAGLGGLASGAVQAAYFAGFAISLIPGSIAGERIGVRRVALFGAGLAALGWLALGFTAGPWDLALARFLTGVAQALVFVSAQSILLAAPAATRTRSMAVIVVAFNAGLIGGVAGGSVLVEVASADAVFALASVALVAVGALVMLLPASPGRAIDTSILRDMGRLGACLRDRAFMSTTVLVGLPAKAALTGIIMVGLPVVMTKAGITPPLVALALLGYGGAVLAGTGLTARVCDRRPGWVPTILTAGLLTSAAGIAVVATLGASDIWPYLAGALLIGLGHSAINAPVVTAAVSAPVADRLGAPAVGALYRTLERVGHVAGPIAVGVLLPAAGYGPGALVVPAIVTAGCACLFLFVAAMRGRSASGLVL